MDIRLLTNLCSNILKINASASHTQEEREAMFHDFERRFCFNPAIQGMYTAKSLALLAGNASPGVIYLLRDIVGVCAVYFTADGSHILIGPFVTVEFRRPLIESMLAGAGFSASVLPPLRMYYNSLPVISSKTVYETVTACLRSLGDFSVEYALCPVIPEEKLKISPAEQRLESSDYSSVYRRYASENHFLRMIETGDVASVKAAYEDMSTVGFENNSYINTMYQDPAVGLAILRTLARKAAERGGASVLDIDEITRRASQSAMSAKSFAEVAKINAVMLTELTEAVIKGRDTATGRSRPVRRAAEYMRLNYGRQLTLKNVAEHAGLSAGYLSTLFREETGSTVTEYLTRLRCEKAAALLESTGLTVQEISAYVGCPDNNNFVKLFRKYYSLTPTQYRNRK